VIGLLLAVLTLVISPEGQGQHWQNTKIYPLFWDGKGNGKCFTEKFSIP
jgi:hypothetical protein